jgi:hypothetical protein
MEPILLAALAGWAFDDICPTPPRPPWPWPGPWPWWIRKFLALVGGAIGYVVVNPQLGRDDIISTVLIGGVGGIVLASLVGGIAGLGGRGAAHVDRQV